MRLGQNTMNMYKQSPNSVHIKKNHFKDFYTSNNESHIKKGGALCGRHG